MALGLERTGRIVTAAAALLAVTFLAFATSGITFIKLFGLGLALAVLMDATLIRATLVPAFMKLAGRANWWAPAWMRRIHDRFGFSEHDPGVGSHGRRGEPGSGSGQRAGPMATGPMETVPDRRTARITSPFRSADHRGVAGARDRDRLATWPGRSTPIERGPFRSTPGDLWARIAAVDEFPRMWPWLRSFDGRGGLKSGAHWTCEVAPPMPYVVRFGVDFDDVAGRFARRHHDRRRHRGVGPAHGLAGRRRMLGPAGVRARSGQLPPAGGRPGGTSTHRVGPRLDPRAGSSAVHRSEAV